MLHSGGTTQTGVATRDAMARRAEGAITHQPMGNVLGPQHHKQLSPEWAEPSRRTDAGATVFECEPGRDPGVRWDRFLEAIS